MCHIEVVREYLDLFMRSSMSGLDGWIGEMNGFRLMVYAIPIN